MPSIVGKIGSIVGETDAGGGGGGGSPGGSNTQVQFNDSGAFGGDADFTYNSTTNVLTVGGEVVTNGIQASTSGGGHLQTNSGADCILFGAGGSANGTLYGGWNYDSGTADRFLTLNAGKTLTTISDATATARLDVFTSSLKGLAPASGGGTTNFLRADGTWAAPSGGGGGGGGGGGATALSTVEKNLGSVPKKAGRFTITGLSGLTINNPVNIVQAVGPYTGKGTRADEAEMDGLIVKGIVTAANTITAYWNAATRVKGNFKFNYFVGA